MTLRQAQGDSITKAQIKKIKTLQGALKMSREDYELLLSEHWCNSCTGLTSEEADKVIAGLEEKAVAAGIWKKLPSHSRGEFPRKYEDLGEREGMASPKQLRFIEGLWKQVSKHRNVRAREKALEWFLDRMTGKTQMRFITKKDAHAVIEAMKKMQEDQERRKA